MNKIIKKILVFFISFFIINTTIYAESKNISIADLSVEDKSSTILVEDPSYTGNNVVSNITFNQKDDYVIFELTLKNNEDDKYKIVNIEDNYDNSNLKFDYTFSEDYMSKNDTTKVKIKMTYKNELLNVDHISLNDLVLKIILEKEDGSSEEIIINPVTGDSIFRYIVLLIITITGLLLIKFRNRKILGSILLTTTLMIIPFVAFAKENYEANIIFSDIDIIGRFETYSITIDSKNGDSVVIKDITYGNKIGLLPADPTKNGYTFNKWVDNNGREITSETIITGPITVEADYDLINYSITYNLVDGSLETGKTNPDSYNIESNDIKLNNPVKVGYNFKGWSGTELTGDSNSTVTITNGSIGERTYTANYTPKTDILYKVKHMKQKLSLDGYVVEETEYLTGTTGTNVTPSVKDYEGFDSPTTQTVEINGDGSTEVEYKYDRKMFDLSFNNNENVISTKEAGSYPYGTVVKVTAKELENKEFSKWSNNETSNPYTFIMNSNITIEPIYNSLVYIISFETDGGSSVNDIEVEIGDQIGTLPNSTKSGSKLLGWYINVTDTDPIDSTYVPQGDLTLHAKWQKVICKKATIKHTEICNNTSSNIGCQGAGYNLGDTIVYGNIISSDNYAPGDAFDCDVDGTGYNNRFYYLTTNDNRLVLISNVNYAGEDGDPKEDNYIYDIAPQKLPTSEAWPNLDVTFEIYENDYRPARFITFDDLVAATGTTNLEATGSLDNYNFLFENTSYSKNTGRSTVWLKELPDGKRYRYHKNNRDLERLTSENYDTSKNAVRPVIEVPIDMIDDAYVVRFNPNGGIVDNEYIRVEKGSSIGTIPTAERDGYIFDGWYTSLDFTISVNENTIPTGYNIYYAKWIPSVELAELNKNAYTILVGSSEQIEITNIASLEPFTYSSSDENIVTVSNSGMINAVNVGSTYINLTGTLSNKTKKVFVIVVTEITECVVSFDTQGGTSVNDLTVNINAPIGELPSTSKTDFIFAGWFTDLNYETEVTAETIITENTTFYALWYSKDDVAKIGNSYYSDLQDAVDSEMTGKTTITILKDVTLNSTLDLSSKNNEKDIVLDLDGHTITYNNANVIKNKATLEIKNGTIKCGSNNSGAIDIENGGKLVMNSGSVIATGSRQGIYNNGGTVELGDSVYVESKADGSNSTKRASVQNVTGTLIITGGTIISSRDGVSYGVTINGGTFILGEEDGTYDTSKISISGNTSGIYSAVNYSIYDGIIKGKDSAVNDESLITNVESGFTKVNNVENEFKTLYFE
ncbi:MAG: InlB B-repeat-containing protein [Bacilli bacterium]|nr:InlB B-repeat-containing protein [Bacilli bacterium]